MTTERSVYVTRKWAAYKEDGTPLWPERFTPRRLQNIRAQLGGYAFSSEYLNEPIDVESRKFRPEWVGWYTAADMDYVNGVSTFHGKPLTTYQGFDPATEEKEDAAIDDSASVVVGITPDGLLPVLYTWNQRVDFPAQVKKVRRIAADFDCQITGIEKRAYQTALQQQILHEAWLSVEGLENTVPKYERITAMSLFFEQMRVYLRACIDCSHDGAPHAAPTCPDYEPGTRMDELGLVRVHPSAEPLYDSLMQFPMAAHDDLPDALCNALQVCGRVRGFGKWF